MPFIVNVAVALHHVQSARPPKGCVVYLNRRLLVRPKTDLLEGPQPWSPSSIVLRLLQYLLRLRVPCGQDLPLSWVN
jgi:hypothetical protein